MANSLKSTERIKTSRCRKTGLWIALCVIAGIALVIFANAHMIYIAVHSQPDCVEHLKSPGKTAGKYRAAKSAC
jgi:hypothetical protein|tara:strand:+ start:15046 stop:15267 length:222 start_codon:yes stop_codon:yes gene_type:complete